MSLTHKIDHKNKLRSYIFLFSMLGIFILSMIAVLEVRSIMRSSKLVVHTYEVIDGMRNALYLVTYAETKQRAYLLYGKHSFLANYNNQLQELFQSVNRVSALTADNTTQNLRVKTLYQVIQERVKILNQMIKFKEANQINSFAAIETFDRGQILSDQIRTQVLDFISTEVFLLNERSTRATQTIYQTTMIFAFGQLIVFLFLCYVYYLFTRQISEQAKIEKHSNQIESQLRGVIDGAPDMIAAVDTGYHFLTLNEAYKKEFVNNFGVIPRVGDNLKELVQDQTKKDILLASWEASMLGQNNTQRLELPQAKEINTYEISSGLLKDEEGERVGAIQIVRNITERIKEQQALQESNEKLHLTTQELQEKNTKISYLLDMSDVILVSHSVHELTKIITKYCVTILNTQHGKFYLMHASRDLLESDAEWGAPKAKTKNFTPDQCWALRLGHIHYALRTDNLICEHVSQDISETWQGYACIPLRAQNDIYGVLYLEYDQADNPLTFSKNDRLIISTFAELTALALSNVRLRENLRAQSIHDPLTGLYNRRYLEEYLSKQIFQCERKGMSFALLLLDLDHFKRVNDVYGHDAGDMILVEFSNILKSLTRSGDLAARYGGEEFIVILYDTNGVIAAERAEQIRQHVASVKLQYGAQEIRQITVSIGVAIYPQDSINARTLIEAADKALYEAKRTGRNKVIASNTVTA